MPDSKNKGGHIEQANNTQNYAAVDEALSSRIGVTNTGHWTVTLKNVPTISNFLVGMHLIYNSKGTSNPNANNYLVVTRVDGPTKYRCDGPYPINI